MWKFREENQFFRWKIDKEQTFFIEQSEPIFIEIR